MASSSKGNIFGSTTSLQMGAGETIPREYHRKILKKIAQLTKVIHNLQTKSDDHEEIVHQLQHKHEEELRQLTGTEKSLQVKLSEQQKSIEELQLSLSSTAEEKAKLQQKEKSLVADMEARFHSIREKHSSQMKELNSSLETTRQQLNQKQKECVKLSSQLLEANEALKNSELRHKLAIENQKKQFSTDITKLQHRIEKNDKAMSELHREHQQEVATLEKRFKEQQAHVALEWKEKQILLEAEYRQKETALHSQSTNTRMELCQVKDELALSQKRMRELENELEETKHSTAKKLKEQEEKVLKTEEERKDLEKKLLLANANLSKQELNLKQLSDTIVELQAMKQSHEHRVQELSGQAQELTIELNALAIEKNSAVLSGETSTKQLKERLQKLDKEVEQLKQERKELHAQFALEIEAAQARVGETQNTMAAQHASQLQEQKINHDNRMQTVLREHNDAIATLRKDLESQYSHEIELLHENYKKELSTVSGSLTTKAETLSVLQDRVKQLELALEERRKKLERNSKNNESLQEEIASTKCELHSTREQLASSKLEMSQLKRLIEAQRIDHENDLKTYKRKTREENAKERLTSEHQWAEKLRIELASQYERLSEQHTQDLQKIMDKMASLKDTALAEADQVWQHEKSRLLSQISQLENEVKAAQQSSSLAVSQVQESYEQQLDLLKEQMAAEKQKTESLITETKFQHDCDIKLMMEEQLRERETMKTLIDALHKQELEEVMKDNELAINNLRTTMHQQQQTELEQLFLQHKTETELLQVELQKQQEASMADLKKQHSSSLEKKHNEWQQELHKLETTIQHQQSTIASLQTNLDTNKKELASEKKALASVSAEQLELRKELQMMKQQVLSMESEAQIKLRMKEQQLISAHHAEMESLVSQHQHQSQILLADFNSAKKLLKTKLNETEKKLSEAELKYRNRESRPEDIERITELNKIAGELERRLKELLAEKRIYQMELMNREKNYNKLFNANPHVGILDPLSIKKSASLSVAMTDGSLRHASAPSLYSPTEAMPTLPPVVPSPKHKYKLSSTSAPHHQLTSSHELPRLAHSPKPPHRQPLRSKVTYIKESNRDASIDQIKRCVQPGMVVL